MKFMKFITEFLSQLNIFVFSTYKISAVKNYFYSMIYCLHLSK